MAEMNASYKWRIWKSAPGCGLTPKWVAFNNTDYLDRGVRRFLTWEEARDYVLERIEVQKNG